MTDSDVGRSLPPRTILLVEDDDGVRDFVRRLLEHAGYTVLTAATPVQAIERAGDHDIVIDLLLTDFGLPGATGAQLGEVLARARPGLRALYMSGYDEEDVRARGDADPDIAYLQKPIAAGRLLQRIRELLQAEYGEGSSQLGS